MRIRCPRCGKGLNVKDEYAGRRGGCPGCGAVIPIPKTRPGPPPETTSSVPVDLNECPDCRSVLPPNAVLCTTCGTDLKTGRRLSTGIESQPERDEIEVSTWIEDFVPIDKLSYVLPFAIVPYGSSVILRRKARVWQGRAWYANLGILIVTGLVSAAALLLLVAGRPGVLRFALWSGDGFSMPQLVTHMFLHAGIAHFLGNMIFLWVFGNALSTALGIVWYPIAYLGLGVLAGYCGHVLPAEVGVDIPAIGASGAICALTGVYLVLFPRHYVQMAIWFRLTIFTPPAVKTFPLKGIYVVLFYMAFDVAAVALGWTGNVAHWVHLAGFGFGLALGIGLLLTDVVSAEGYDLLTWIMGERWRQASAKAGIAGAALAAAIVVGWIAAPTSEHRAGEHYCRGVGYAKRGEHNRAIREFTRAIEHKPNCAELHHNRGLSYGQKGDLDRAIADYTKAIKLKPDLTKAYYNRGLAYNQKGDLDRARQDFEKAVELDPDGKIGRMARAFLQQPGAEKER